MRDISVFKKLELLSLSENKIATDSIIRELSTLPNLNSFTFRRNPLIDTQGEGHVQQLIIVYLEHLKCYNNDKRFCRKDCELYILRHSFHQYFNLFKLDQFTYKYENFCTWATAHYPVTFRLVDKYENPYPPLDKEKLDSIELENLQRKAAMTNFVNVEFLINCG